jgi:GNAT superfamily N-acetyltransferase
VSVHIRVAETREELERCFAVMHELRPHLEAGAFVEQVLRQNAAGYRLAYVEEDGAVQACAGYRLLENLAWGRFLYVDDLVTAPEARSRGFGAELLGWLKEKAREAGCRELHLDSGVQRFAAHRFYLRERMEITSHHFGMKL